MDAVLYIQAAREELAERDAKTRAFAHDVLMDHEDEEED